MLGVEQHDGGGGDGGARLDEMMMSGGGGGGGNRWPRQETLALLRIRSDMDISFRDSNLKGPLWEQVSRKMAELGFERSAKKCKEKFENVYKYHKRTKDGRSTKPDGKSYRFFDQLEAFELTPPPRILPPPPVPTAPSIAPIASSSHANIPNLPNVTATTHNINPLNPIPCLQPPSIMPPHQQATTFQRSLNIPHMPTSILSNSTSSSSTSSDEGVQMRRGKKRKWKDFFERLMRDVVQKQEELQKKFFDTLEKREKDRVAREEAWRVQEMAKMNREHELLVKERSIAAAKDSAVIAFLQKVSEQHNVKIPISNDNNKSPEPAPPPPVQPQQSPTPSPPAAPLPVPSPVSIPSTKTMVVSTASNNNGGTNTPLGASSSRWPKSEIEALINIRTSLDFKYQDNGPKGPLWEEISGAMSKLGYNRNSKRCKEKWENINKYYKKVKESNKKRPQDSKTCPYFNQLDAIYKERAKNDQVVITTPQAPIMARPEQQWPVPQRERESENNEEEEEEEYDDDEEYDDNKNKNNGENNSSDSGANAGVVPE